MNENTVFVFILIFFFCCIAFHPFKLHFNNFFSLYRWKEMCVFVFFLYSLCLPLCFSVSLGMGGRKHYVWADLHLWMMQNQRCTAAKQKRTAAKKNVCDFFLCICFFNYMIHIYGLESKIYDIIYTHTWCDLFWNCYEMGLSPFTFHIAM